MQAPEHSSELRKGILRCPAKSNFDGTLKVFPEDVKRRHINLIDVDFLISNQLV
jgi:hypothetical protein